MKLLEHLRVAGWSAVGLLTLGGAAWAAPATISMAHKAPFGDYLTDGTGRTVYMFTADKKDMSACNGACAGAWPPVLSTGAPVAGKGVTASALGTIKRGAEEQVTYDGMPLYLFVRDTAAGSTAGEGINHFGGSWYLVAPDGKGILPSGKQQ
jgi:predicted lipoprotein with Yx(FWY)xxD motif